MIHFANFCKTNNQPPMVINSKQDLNHQWSDIDFFGICSCFLFQNIPKEAQEEEKKEC